MRHTSAAARSTPQQQFSFFDAQPPAVEKSAPPAHAVIRHRLLGAGELALGALVAAALPPQTRAVIVTHSTHRARLLADELTSVLGTRREVSLLTSSVAPRMQSAGLFVSTAEALAAQLIDHPDLLDDIGCLLVERGELLGDASFGPSLELLLTRVRTLAGSMPRMVIWLDGAHPAATDVEYELHDWLGIGPQGALAPPSSRALPILPLGRLLVHAAASGPVDSDRLLELARRSLTARRLWRGTRGMGRLRAAIARAVDACARAGLLERNGDKLQCTPRGHVVARFGLDLETTAALATWGRRVDSIAPLARITELALTPHGRQIAAALPRRHEDPRNLLLAKARDADCLSHPVFAWLAQSLAALEDDARRALLLAEVVHAHLGGESVADIGQRLGCHPALLAALITDFGGLIAAQMALTPTKTQRYRDLEQLAERVTHAHPQVPRPTRPARTRSSRRRTVRARGLHTPPHRPNTLPLAGLG